MALRRLVPLFDRVLVERLTPVSKTKGGVLLPETSQGKMNQGQVLAVGEGRINEKGERDPVSVAVGDTVLLPEYGGTKIELDEKEYVLFRDGDLLGKFKPE
ncbi:10 kDa heat shock protein, mitochondrial-like [Oscarella lobularis]|uniref:10 kDa heat shock protein, mitochondrial-like n=1 Tax=Oscarella lobularis TaxID=121494 RepID=UPI003313DB22